jgi:peptidoglycan/LPS O-acetylase OafA/YrhL
MNQNKLPGIQIARAAAALSIAYLHSWHVTMPFPPDTAYPIPLLKDHAIGVDFFFAISGFVICIIVTSQNDLAGFAIRRVFRLYPLWIATSLAYLLLTVFLGRGPNQTAGFFLYSLTLLPTGSFPFYDLGWTLQHEMAFYLLTAIVAPRFGIAGLMAALTAGTIADHVLQLPWYLHKYFVFYDSFLAGMVAFALHRQTSRFGVIVPLAASIATFWLSETVLDNPRTLLPLGLLLGLTGFLNMKPRSLAASIGGHLGDASYSIYLIHPLVFYAIYILLQPPLPPIWTEEILRFGAIVAICGISIASWKMFEQPMISVGARIASRLQDSRSMIGEEGAKTVALD